MKKMLAGLVLVGLMLVVALGSVLVGVVLITALPLVAQEQLWEEKPLRDTLPIE
jgi:hypothetical protein